jgi:neutral ceramidase
MKFRTHFTTLRAVAHLLTLLVFVLTANPSRIFAAPLGPGAVAATETPALSGSLQVGAAKVDITPSNLTNLNSFGGSFTDVHDPIFARALVVENGVSTVAFVACDLIEIGDTTQVRQRIQTELGIPVDHILITASHDHNAPRAGSVTPGGLAHGNTPETDAFTSMLYDKILDALKLAKGSEKPARFGLGQGSVDVNVNRDEYKPQGWGLGFNPDRQSDKTVWVMKFESTAGEPIAVLFNYAVHSTVALGTGRLSGDLGGEAERFVEQKYGNNIVALYTMGSAGDQNPRFTGSNPTVAKAAGAAGSGGNGGPGGQGAPPGNGARSTQSAADRSTSAFDAIHALGFMLGSEVVRVSAGIQQMNSSAQISAGERIVSCPTKQGANQLADMKQQQAATMPLHLGLILINDVALTGVSGEVVTNIYWHLRKASPLSNTIMLTIANDRLGYIADDAAYDTPYFEVNGSPLARGCAENAIVNNLVEMIRQYK